ncbi:hypothetical protein PENSPDRAFT_756564, partial [Peniophora sp. CONT]
MSFAPLYRDLETRRREAQEAWTNFLQLRFEGGALNSDEMDIEVEAMNRSLSHVHRECNARTITHRIPPELLCAIFDFARVGWEPRRFNQQNTELSTYEAYTLGWTTITHVCHRWRGIALQTPVLWCDVDIVNLHPGLARAFSQRGSTLPLTMIVQPLESMQPFVDDVAAKACGFWQASATLERLQRFSFQEIAYEIFLKYLSPFCPLPNSLQELRLHVSDSWDADGSIVFLPLNIIRVPNTLKRLSLRGCFARPDNPIFSPSIIHLDIQLGAYTPSPAISSAPAFVRLLSTLPLLEELYLYNFPCPRETTVAATVTLPDSFRLLRWGVDGYVDGVDLAMCTLLGGLLFPAQTTMVLDLEHCHTPGIREKLAGLALWDMRSCQTPLEIVSGTIFATLPWRADAWATQVLDPEHLWFEDISLPPGMRGVRSHIEPLVGEAIVAPDKLLNSVHAFTIGEGSVHNDGPTDTAYWFSRCALIPNTRCITLPIFYSHWMTKALEARSETSAGPVILPNLEILAFDVLVDEDHSLEDHLQDTLFHGITRMVKCRRDMCAPLKEVRIKEPMAGCDIWDKVRELVAVTIWR